MYGLRFFERAERLTPLPKVWVHFLAIPICLVTVQRWTCATLHRVNGHSWRTWSEAVKVYWIQQGTKKAGCKRQQNYRVLPTTSISLLLSHGQTEWIGRMSINWPPPGQYLIPIPNHPGVKMAESTHHTHFTRILSPLNFSNRCQAWKNATYIESLNFLAMMTIQRMLLWWWWNWFCH